MDVAELIENLADERCHPALPGSGTLPARLMMALVAVLPAAAAAGISLRSRADHRVPLGASDDTAALAERLQCTVGEGPGLNALKKDRAVLVTEADMAARWPAFHDEMMTRTPYRSMTLSRCKAD